MGIAKTVFVVKTKQNKKAVLVMYLSLLRLMPSLTRTDDSKNNTTAPYSTKTNHLQSSKFYLEVLLSN